MSNTPGKRQKDQDFALVGRTIADKYRVIRVLGQGGFGAVYLVEIVAGMIGERLALKVLPPEFSQNEKVHERFLNEIRVSMKLVNKYIVQVRDVGVSDDGLLYYTMDYSPGVTLTEVILANGRLPVLRSLSLVRRVLRGLMTAHKQGVIHRDLKPGNLMVEDQKDGETIRILDFGIATAIQFAGKKSMQVVGSPLYMPPEQFAGQEVGFYTDLYAVGVTLYECLTGERPYTGRTAKEIFMKMKIGPPRPIEEFCPGVAEFPGLAEAVGKSLERDPARRYQNAAEMFNDLTAIVKARRQARAEAVAEQRVVFDIPRKRWSRSAETTDFSRIFTIVLLLLVIGSSVYYLKPYFSEVKEVVDGTVRRSKVNEETGNDLSGVSATRPDSSEVGPGADVPIEVSGVSESTVSHGDGAGESRVPPSGTPEQIKPEPSPESQAVALLARAQDAFDGKIWDEAIAMSQRAAELSPEHRERALEFKARAEFSAASYKEAAATLDALVEEIGHDQASDDLLFRAMRFHERAGTLILARNLGDDLGERGYDSREFILLMLKVVHELGDEKRVLTYLTVAEERGIENHLVKRARRKYVTPTVTPEQIAEVRSVAERAFLERDYRVAENTLLPVFEETRDVEMGLLLAEAQMIRRNIRGARTTVDELSRLPNLAPETRVRIGIIAGRVELPSVDPLDDRVSSNHVNDVVDARQKFSDALQMLKDASRLPREAARPLESEIRTYLARCFAFDANLLQADRETQSARKIADTNGDLVYEQGQSYLILAAVTSNPETRETAYSRLVSRMSHFNALQKKGRVEDPRGYLFLGIGYHEIGPRTYSKAIKAFKTALEVNKKCDKSRRVEETDLLMRLAKTHRKKAETRNSRSEFLNAARRFEEAFDRKPDDETCFQAASCYVRAKRDKDGCKVLARGLERNPKSNRLMQLWTRFCRE